MRTKQGGKSRARGASTKKVAPKSGNRRPKLPTWVVVSVWTRAAGRCEFRGCNEAVWKDLLTTHEYNRGKLAHIVAASPDGPRGDPIESPRLAKEPSNLMLLCGTHHDQVDDHKLVHEFTVDVLRQHKADHHARIEALTEIAETTKSVPVVLQAPIYKHAAAMPVDDVKRAIAGRRRYPDDRRRIEIDLLGMSSRDHDTSFWEEARKRIHSTWETALAARSASGPLEHLSIFAIAPIPLLIDFGRLIGDKANIEVFNCHREPKGWVWPSDRAPLSFSIEAPTVNERGAEVALALSVSSQVQRVAIEDVLAPRTSVFEVRTRDPTVDTLRRPEDLRSFVVNARAAMEFIHRAGATRIHVFGGVPVAAAVEFGRCLLPKLHGELVLYDYNSANKGWHRAFSVA